MVYGIYFLIFLENCHLILYLSLRSDFLGLRIDLDLFSFWILSLQSWTYLSGLVLHVWSSLSGLTFLVFLLSGLQRLITGLSIILVLLDCRAGLHTLDPGLAMMVIFFRAGLQRVDAGLAMMLVLFSRAGLRRLDAGLAMMLVLFCKAWRLSPSGMITNIC